MYWSRVRQEGFIRRLAKGGFTVHLYEPPGPPARVPWEAEQASVTDWLKSLPKPIGLLACNDDRAQQVFEANKAADIRVPDEIAILGVDNDDMICELTHPPLSSVAMNFEEAGYEAAAQLDRQMKGKRFPPGRSTFGPRTSTPGNPRMSWRWKDPVVAKAMRFIRAHA
jgi:LacI family transcriptional regulator